MNLKKYGTEFIGFTDISGTLMARDFKRFGQQGQTGVLEIYDEI